MMNIENSRARYDYEILETYECGMMLESWEVKSIAKFNVNINGSHVKLFDGEAYLVGSRMGSDLFRQDRTRKLLLNRSELKRLIGKTQQNGLTLVPLKLYDKKGKFKLEVALCKGKKLHDKRETEKKRDIENENRRIIKSQKIEG